MGSSSILSLLILTACVSPAERFSRIAARDPETAIESANQWRARHAPDHPQWPAVVQAEAEAAFSVAAAANTVTAWQDWQLRYPEATGLRPEARLREASAAWREVVQARDTVEAYRWFRERYPEAGEIKQARSQEVRAALAAATSKPGLDTLRSFRSDYADWPEADEARTTALAEEAKRALDRARADGTTVALRAWLDKYGHDSIVPNLVVEAHVLADQAIASESVDALLRGRWDDATLQGWLSRDAELPTLAKVGAARREKVLLHAVEADSANGWWVASLLLSGTLEEADLRDKARLRAWEDSADPANAGTFAGRFPEDPRAWDAEGRWLAWRERTSPRARQVRVQRRRVLPNGEVELTLDVVNCEGRRLAGLTRDSFTIWEGEQKLPITAFTSLEQDRPLELVVAVDLSGSMATERKAVDAAVERFAETLRFRNRAVALGLVGFSDGVMVDEAPSARIADFHGWIRRMPDNLGGGAEDTAGGLMAAIGNLRGAKSERVVVLLSDEKLQVNLHGRRALGLEETSCDEARSVGGCLGSCGGDNSCILACLTNGPPRFASLTRGCGNGNLLCASRAIDQTSREVNRCQSVADHPEIPDVLAARLQAADVRTYVLAVRTESEGYGTLAGATGGRVIEVPDNTADPSPYEAALLDIADQLSKQFVVTYQPMSAAVPATVVSAEWRWSEVEVPTDAGGGVSQLQVDSTSLARLRVEVDGSVSRALDGQAWRTVLAADPGRRHLVSADVGEPMVCADGDGGIHCSSDLGRTWAPLGPPVEGPLDLLSNEHGLYARQEGQAWTLLRVRSRDLPASSLYFATNDDKFQPSLEPFIVELGRALAERADLRLRVEGHADARGSDATNDDLALRRAKRVAEAIQFHGARSDQIAVQSFGERKPVRLGKSQADYQRNRRVELVLLEPPPPNEALCR